MRRMSLLFILVQNKKNNNKKKTNQLAQCQLLDFGGAIANYNKTVTYLYGKDYL